ncbi:MAG: hypothetical protein UR52_C0007G0011 [Candidatus Gottesmanbacteria bacterium GW2011_GWA1_34_13]|uniref:Uncharacterized protein n=1 Tax=Candidatus Gottesmanbacteria bacterium GW2011_GWA1_34_13 TaxID=1618434 RepID=A0A0G0B6P0_9BACT|nr:MAG: hypothetical protein UR52_C0007G0011 [Candidatus Gottesmanbacteria bacterium GW2011_GWA1_34_13]
MIERILGKSQILFAAEGSTGGTVKKAVLKTREPIPTPTPAPEKPPKPVEADSRPGYAPDGHYDPGLQGEFLG